MVKIVATQNMPYGHRRYVAGEEFDASEKDARLLVKIGRAAHVSPARQAQTVVQPVSVAPAPEVTAPEPKEAAPEAPASPQQYHRRDMTAEPAGQTGPAPRSQSSRRGRRQKRST